MVKNIWKSYIWTADRDVNESDPRGDVHYLGSSENKAWKKFHFTGLFRTTIMTSSQLALFSQLPK